MNKNITILRFLIISILSIAVILYLYPKSSPFDAVDYSKSPEDIIGSAEKILDKMNISAEGYEASVRIKKRNALIRQLQYQFGLEKSNALLRDSVPGYYRYISWNKKEESRIFFGDGNEDKIRRAIIGEFALGIDRNSYLIELNIEIPDSVELSQITAEEAKRIADNFIQTYSPVDNLLPDSLSKIKDEKSTTTVITTGGNGRKKTNPKINSGNRTDYKFIYSGIDPITKDRIEASVSIRGNIVSKYELKYDVPEKFKEQKQLYGAIVMIVVYLMLFVIIVFFAFKRFRNYEIGFRNALIIGIISMLFFAFNLYLTTQVAFRAAMLLGMTLGGLFIGGAALFSFAVAESLGREVFHDKFYSIDLAAKGHLLHSKVGKALFNGLGFGLLLSAVWFLTIFVFRQIFDFSITPELSDDGNLNSVFPFFSLLFKTFYSDIFEITLFFLLVGAIIKSKFNSGWIFIFVPAILWTLGVDTPVNEWIIKLITQLPLGIILAYSLLKFDILTALIALLTFNVTDKGIGYILTGGSEPTGALLIIIFLFLTIVAVVSLFTKDEVENLDSIAPAFAEYINERQRMQRQLEIARDVQMSFLPSETPDIRGLQIAAKCVPAYEVGGDYYDFIPLGEKKLGVAIGDVSGKGTQAAFYMTLTKGFLKALAKSYDSPAEILSRMNELFYENVERGHFISMIYAIFDLKEMKLTVARAGHNPLIIKNSKDTDVKSYQPQGLALGLEKGEIFRKTIKEESVRLTNGDQILFYTDGFTEAMNKNKEEYGDERLRKFINEHSDLTPSEFIKEIIKDVNRFIQKAKQYDDMTIVCIKII